ncbi:amidohydrolase family protein [Rhodococcus daqingensis]|uniref:Amidohydrolase n=1 Tax=Rhodococcus daqingensis TaxID=2479363 RepID=A0ABW2RUL4_9NOCA
MNVDVENLWCGAWLGPCRLTARGGRLVSLRRRTPTDGHADLEIPGVVFAGLRDAHVHLGLVDARALFAGGLAVVHDLGSSPTVLAPFVDAAVRDGLPEVSFAGQFLTVPGGYPTDRWWAAADSVCIVEGPQEAAAAVDVQILAGATFVKVMLNSVAGPVFDDATLEVLVGAAHARDRLVVVHAEGPGQALRAFESGADLLAHTPWTEPLPEELLAAMARSMRWVSTLDIHGRGGEFDVAADNLRRFCAAGGVVVYGTDQGNGPQPVGVNPRELTALLGAGLDRESVLESIAVPWPAGSATRLAWTPGPPPAEDEDWASWLAETRNLDTAQIKERFG